MAFIQLFKVKQSNLKPSLQKKPIENVIIDKLSGAVSESNLEILLNTLK